MKHFCVLMALLISCLVTPFSFADTGPLVPKFEPYAPATIPNSTPAFSFVKQDTIVPPPSTYNIEAIYDKDSKAAAVGASAFWKRFTRKGKTFDVHFFAGLDKRQIPVGAILGKFKWSPVDQLDISFGPALELKQSKLIGMTLFVGVSLK